jgi:sigma-B regulation protein RsbU (phosphoserine phosphatase)
MPAKILIVDDEPDLELLLRQRFRRHLRDLTYDFRFTRNGEEALAALRAEPDIDLVLSDINMPVMDGLTLLSNLGQLRPRPATVIVSAYGDMANIRAAMNLGAFDFLTKPIDFHDFEVTVEKTLRQIHELRQAERNRERLLVMERDLATAAQIQRSFLPQPDPALAGRPDVAVHACMLPARAVGGDFYDYFLLDGRRLAVVVGDVAGKGVPAALFMAVTRTLLRAHAFRGLDPAACLAAVNEELLRDCASMLFVTVFYGILDTGTGELDYSTGGHHLPFLLRGGGGVEAVNGKGLLVGALPEAVYRSGRLRLAPGDVAFFFTDGVIEARDPGGRQFSRQALEAALGQCDRSDPERIVEDVIAAVQRFAAGAPQWDDLTALALRFTGTAPPV